MREISIRRESDVMPATFQANADTQQRVDFTVCSETHQQHIHDVDYQSRGERIQRREEDLC